MELSLLTVSSRRDEAYQQNMESTKIERKKGPFKFRRSDSE